MPYTPPTVNYSATIDGTYTSLTGVQSVSIHRGRQRIADPFPQSSCVVELIPANSYAVPLAIGQFFDVRQTNSSASRAFFSGRITDVERVYAMPYNSGTGAAPADRIRITATGGTGILATNYAPYSWSAGAWSGGISNVQTVSNVRIQAEGSTFTISAQSIEAGGLDVLNTLLNTVQKVVDDADESRNDDGYGGEVFVYQSSPNAVSFSDTGTGFAMKNLQFVSSAQNTFTRVNIDPAGLATQTSTTGSAPYNTLNVNTYNGNTTDALSLSGYLLGLNSTQLQAAPALVQTDTTVAETCINLLHLCLTGPTYGYIGSPVTIIFRGQTLFAAVQGVSGTFYPDYASVQLYCSPNFGTPFTLDSSVFGVLDQNRLGF
jgi:hypothetical protein